MFGAVERVQASVYVAQPDGWVLLLSGCGRPYQCLGQPLWGEARPVVLDAEQQLAVRRLDGDAHRAALRLLGYTVDHGVFHDGLEYQRGHRLIQRQVIRNGPHDPQPLLKACFLQRQVGLDVADLILQGHEFPRPQGTLENLG